MVDRTDTAVAIALANEARREFILAVAQNPKVRRLYLDALAADLQALTTAEVANAAEPKGSTVLPFPGGDLEIGGGHE